MPQCWSHHQLLLFILCCFTQTKATSLSVPLHPFSFLKVNTYWERVLSNSNLIGRKELNGLNTCGEKPERFIIHMRRIDWKNTVKPVLSGTLRQWHNIPEWPLTCNTGWPVLAKNVTTVEDLVATSLVSDQALVNTTTIVKPRFNCHSNSVIESSHKRPLPASVTTSFGNYQLVFSFVFKLS